jgi:thioredoxin reductase (NADPH)
MADRNVIIIGSGPAGFTAAIYTARAGLEPLVYAGLEWGGQLQNTTEVENYPGFPDGLQGPEMMELFRKQAERFGAEVLSEDVTRVDFSERPFKIWSGDDVKTAKAVIISTGAAYRHLDIPGEDELAGHGVSYCATCDGFFFRDKDIVVVGGGDTAMEEALFLTRFGKAVKVVHRRDELRASKIMQDRAFANDKISFVWDSALDEAVGTNGKLSDVRLTNLKTGKESTHAAEGLFIAIGHDPATKLFEGQIELDDAGYISVHDGSRTSVEGVFAGGDCVDHVYRQAITAAGMGCMAAIDAERWLESQSHLAD